MHYVRIRAGEAKDAECATIPTKLSRDRTADGTMVGVDAAGARGWVGPKRSRNICPAFCLRRACAAGGGYA